MIKVSLLGMDHVFAITASKPLHAELVKIYNCQDDDLIFFAPESFIIHDGVEQTSFFLDVLVEASDEYRDLESAVKEAIFKALKDIAIHIRVLFSYFDADHEYVKIDQTYPRYMSEDNVVKAEVAEDEDEHSDDFEEYEEPYMGDIIGEYDRFIQEHPNATNEEIYEALTGIRKEQEAKHKKK